MENNFNLRKFLKENKATYNSKLLSENLTEESSIYDQIDPTTAEVDGVHSWDYPDFVDSFISYAEFKDGRELTDEELDQLNDTEAGIELAQELAHSSLHEGEGDKKKSPETENDLVREVLHKAEEFGISPDKLGKEEYSVKMAQAAVEALTDCNYHPEARTLVSVLEGKPELAEKPVFPSSGDPDYDEKVEDLIAKYKSIYSEPDSKTRKLGLVASHGARFAGDEALKAIAEAARLNGLKDLSEKMLSVL